MNAVEQKAREHSDLPLLIVQSLSDEVVLPNTTALLNQRFCAARADLTTLWLDQVQHQNTANVAGPEAILWLNDRFERKPTQPTCGQPLPIAPAS